MFNWLKKRLNEPTTYIGLGTLVAGAGQVAKINEAPEIASAIVQSGQGFATGDYVSGVGILLAGVFGAFMREKGDK